MTEQEFMVKVAKVLTVFGEKFRQGDYPDRKLPILITDIYIELPNEKTFVVDSLTFATERFLSAPVEDRCALLEKMSQEDADRCIYLPTTGQMFDAKDDIVKALVTEGIPADSISVDCAYDD